MISPKLFRKDVPHKKLGDLVIFLDHIRKPITASEREAGLIPYYGANGIQDYVKDFLFDEDLVLLAEDGGHFEDADRGVAYKVSGKTWVNNHAHVLQPTEIINVDYLFRVLQNLDLTAYINGTTRAKLTKANAARIEIPLPPLAEQQRIAALLDTADRILRLREAAIAKLDELEASVFLQLIDGFNDEEGIALSEVTMNIKNISPANLFADQKFTYIDIGSVSNETKSIISENMIIGIDAPSRAKQEIEMNDVLVSTVRPNLNAVAKVDHSYINPVASTGFCVLRCDTRKILPQVIFSTVKSNKFIEAMVKSATGASYPAVTDKVVKSYKLPKIAMNEQIRFAEFISICETKRIHLYAQISKMKQLIQSLQHQSFAVN